MFALKFTKKLVNSERWQVQELKPETIGGSAGKQTIMLNVLNELYLTDVCASRSHPRKLLLGPEKTGGLNKQGGRKIQ